MTSTVCPSCGRALRSAAGCSCGGRSETTWHLPAFELAIERRVRLFAIPVALVLAWAAVHAGFLRMLVRTVLSMWIHELGHAVAAWLCGRFAVPGPWFTPVGAGRSLIVVLLVAVALTAGAIRLWAERRP